jgi:hypothetical protein
VLSDTSLVGQFDLTDPTVLFYKPFKEFPGLSRVATYHLSEETVSGVGRMKTGKVVKYEGTSAVKRVINPQPFHVSKSSSKDRRQCNLNASQKF